MKFSRIRLKKNILESNSTEMYIFRQEEKKHRRFYDFQISQRYMQVLQLRYQVYIIVIFPFQTRNGCIPHFYSHSLSSKIIKYLKNYISELVATLKELQLLESYKSQRVTNPSKLVRSENYIDIANSNITTPLYQVNDLLFD